MSVDAPVPTVTARDRFALIGLDKKPGVYDILFRMLRPHELAQAQGFGKGFKFSGTREQCVKQIGNAVPVNLAAALCKTLISDIEVVR